MEFKKGFKAKPESISHNGVVSFTDGTNTVQVNQVTCEAYGYRYNSFNGTCEITNVKISLNDAFKKGKNTVKGVRNKLESAVNNVLINGNNNSAKGQNNNILISGTNNKVENGVNNAAILSGNNAQAIRTGEVIVGGSQNDGLPVNIGSGVGTFRTQTSSFHMTTTIKIGGAIEIATLAGVGGITGIPMSKNSLCLLEGRAIATSETLGDKYMSLFTAVVTCNSNGKVNVTNFVEDTPLVDSIGNFGIGVQDGSDVNALIGGSTFNEGEAYIAVTHDLLSGTGATKNIAASFSIKLTEQIHSTNSNVNTNL